MEMKQLKYFVEVARREHISDAALELNIAQSAISRQIAQLEKELNVTLFKRSGRNIILTAEGKQLLSEATQILDQLDKTIQLFKQQSSTDQRTIYIGYEESDVSQMMLPLVQTFEQQSKSLATPQLMTHEDIVEQVVSGQLDIGFVELTKEISAQSQLHTTSLFEENYHMYVPKDHPIAMTTQPPLTQFENKPLYCLMPFSNSIKNKLEYLIKSHVYVVSNKQLAQYILRKNKGFVVCNQNIHLPSHQDWTYIPLSHTELKRTMCAITKYDNKKADIDLMWQFIHTMMNQTAQF
ncbi:LysR family transcriptional regulator [Staphylococcus caprae]|uniref:glutamate biosynthesis transcriptional regulator GltC n=1 Tax=Staphylococcus TaxID=1279 RepID=UPI0008A9FA0C|nr:MULTISPECIES: LysR family transcriptional regulator [Staphylococcus]MBU5272764.1 LysR family transcriptional regulator [Staphylococcus caprae]MCI2954640.1 LysR family transcriptional regulator [Staphylococcus caprae]MDK6298388.1 LysR family transcriptional regulator [Staphylococcus caprae]MDK7233304.1 LysR family transcriptional regulator [Staphylococcus caprae]OHS41710.1 LysR family transcriptional regulator [Staphylococcus sp. HMSC62A08]